MSGRTRQGSALLVVLGFMALIVTAAVCFATRMRAARHPNATLVSAARGRFLLAAALARALSEIDADIGERMFADWPDRVRGAADSSATNGVVAVLTLESLAYLPAGLVDGVRRRAAFADTARWQRLNYDAGRVAYLAVDVSDLPDVNGTPVLVRRTFASGGRLSLLPFFSDEDEAKRMDQALQTGKGDHPDIPYVSLLDLNIATGDASRILSGEEVDPLRLFVADSHAFSRAETDEPAAVALTDAPEAWEDVLRDGLSETDWEVLCDYLDEDSVPASLELPCAERVPQLGAVGWRDDGGGAALKATLAFPFRRCVGVDGTYRAVASLTVSSSDGLFAASGEVAEEIVPERDFEPDGSTRTLTFALPEGLLPSAADEDEQPVSEKSVDVKLSMQVVDEDGETVDWIPVLSFVAVCKEGRLSSVGPSGYAVADSRVNWKLQHWQVSDEPVELWFGEECESGCIVSDAGYLQSMGELAFLPREDGSSLDGRDFALADDREEGPRVDPYTASTNVMMMALLATPRDWRASATNAVSEEVGTLEDLFGATRDDFEKIAVRLMTALRAEPNADWQTAYDELDWLGDGEGVDPLDGVSFADRLKTSDRQFLRDYWRGCLAKRQQLFLVFMRVEYGPRGLAVMARDPYPSPDGAPHRMKVLFYRQFDNRF